MTAASSYNSNLRLMLWLLLQGLGLTATVSVRAPFSRQISAHRRALHSTLSPQSSGPCAQVNYEPPQGLSPELESLLKAILVADPTKRPSVAQLLAHPWVAVGLPPGMLQCNEKVRARSTCLQSLKLLLGDIFEESNVAFLLLAPPEVRLSCLLMHCYAATW